MHNRSVVPNISWFTIVWYQKYHCSQQFGAKNIMVHNSFLRTCAIQYGLQHFGVIYIMVHNSLMPKIHDGAQQIGTKYIMLHNSLAPHIKWFTIVWYQKYHGAQQFSHNLRNTIWFTIVWYQIYNVAQQFGAIYKMVHNSFVPNISWFTIVFRAVLA